MVSPSIEDQPRRLTGREEPLVSRNKESDLPVPRYSRLTCPDGPSFAEGLHATCAMQIVTIKHNTRQPPREERELKLTSRTCVLKDLNPSMCAMNTTYVGRTCPIGRRFRRRPFEVQAILLEAHSRVPEPHTQPCWNTCASVRTLQHCRHATQAFFRKAVAIVPGELGRQGRHAQFSDP